MDRYKEDEFECHNCNMIFKIGYEISNTDPPICCPFCGSLEIKQDDNEEDEEKEKDDDED